MTKIKAPYEEQEQGYAEPDYTKNERSYLDFLIKRMTKARNMREDTHIEFDDMNYDEYYESNYKAGNAYIRPKKNKEDSRIVTGTTLEKENTLLSAVLNYNFEPNISVFDKLNMPLIGLGDKLESLVKKSREMEDYEMKRALIYKEGADQGTAFVEDTWVEEYQIQKKLKDFDYKEDPKNIKWSEKREKKIVGCQANLIPGTGVYLGNIKEFFEHKQPFIVTRDVITYEEAKARYGDYARFEFVPKRLTREIIDENEIREWTLEELEEGFVEILKYQDKWANEYMLLLNGVMMLPAGFPLTAISPSGEYTLVKLDIEPISQFFAYSKSYPAKTKVDQEILDDTLRTMVLRMRQMLEPPLANNTGMTLNRNVFYPGNVEDDIDPNRIQRILGDQGIGAGEFQVYSLIKQIVDEKTSAPIIGGASEGGRQTATEITTKKQQSLMKLGYAIYGILNFEQKLTWLRIYNILENWTNPIDTRVDDLKNELKDVYKTISVEETDENGQFTRIIEFNEEGLDKSKEQLDAEAKLMSTPKRTIQKVYLNPKMIKGNFLKWLFKINITPTEKETTQLEGAMFDERVMKYKQTYGPESTNDEYCKQRSAILAGEDPKKMFAQQQPMMPGMMPGGPGNAPEQQGMPGAQQTPITQDVLSAVKGGMQRPSLNTLEK